MLLFQGESGLQGMQGEPGNKGEKGNQGLPVQFCSCRQKTKNANKEKKLRLVLHFMQHFQLCAILSTRLLF